MRAVALAKLVLLVIVVVLGGCGATSVLVGAEEPDLVAIRPGTPRPKVEKALGRPLWHPGSDALLRYEVYQYPVARDARPAAGLFILAMDYFALGMSEWAFKDRRDLEPVNQVLIGYDGDDRVGFISSPWTVTTYGPCRRLRANLPTSLDISWSDPAPSGETEAILRVDWELSAVVDDRLVKGDISLAAGRHSLSVTEPGLKASADLDVKSGRTYLARYKYYGEAYGTVIWLEDEASEEVLACADRIRGLYP